jgi:hypothetical protein
MSFRPFSASFLLLVTLAACLLTPPPCLWAAPASAFQAKRVVENWLQLDPRPLNTALGAQVREVVTYRDQGGDPAYFIVYLIPRGFVIVPADDLVEPIIGFVPKGVYDPSPINPLGDLVSHDVPGRVSRMRTSEAEELATGRPGKYAGLMQEARRKWRQLSGYKALPPNQEAGLANVTQVWVNPFVQSRWGQGDEGLNHCYNLFTPGNRVSGCVATAMAQLMRYWQHPAVGVGNVSFDISVCGGAPFAEDLLGGDGAGGAYVWIDMTLDPDGNTGLAQRQAIGRLTHDAGVAVNMDYCLESTSDTLDAANALTGTFSYTNARRGYNDGNELPVGARNAMINPNLDARHPVILGIRGGVVPNTRGHAVIVDGYGYDLATLYHHLNMGWRGADDAWYNLPNIDSNPDFDVLRKCVYNVYTSGTGEIISGRVTRAGIPIEGAEVFATRVDTGEVYSSITDANGIYALVHLPSQSMYLINVNHTGDIFTPQTALTGLSTDDTTVVGNVWGINFAAFINTGIPLREALDNANLKFNRFGNALWYGQDGIWTFGGSAAQSGAIGNLQSSSLETKVEGPSRVSFSWKVSSEEGHDYLRVYVDGVPHGQISGEQDWQVKTLVLSKGSHTVKWEYSKDAALAQGYDCGWVDKVVVMRISPGALKVLLLE